MGLQALGFVAADADRLHRFLDLSGLRVEELRTYAGDPTTLAGVLEHLMQDESLLLSSAAKHRLTPDEDIAAYRRLSGATIDGSDFD